MNRPRLSSQLASPGAPLLFGAGFVVLVLVAGVLALGPAADSSAEPSFSATARVAAPSPAPSTANPTASPAASPTASPPAPTLAPAPTPSPPPPSGSPMRTPTPAPTPTQPGATSTAFGWQPDPALDRAKAEGRVILASDGTVTIAPAAPAPPGYPSKAALSTSWSGLIQEPPPSGTDAAGQRYRDNNYANLCGPGAAAVVLYYWPASHQTVTTKSGTFTEPVNLGTNRYATTTWTATGSGGNARGMIMYLAEVQWPAPDKGKAWWPRPGMMNWSTRSPSTDIWDLADGLNWEASGHASVDYFYSIVSASDLTAAALRDHVHSDINAGVPLVIAARTANGSVSLPDWKVTSTRSAVNHYVTLVGYDDDAGTYTVMDTCGAGCNNRGVRGGVGQIGQAALFALIQAESDNDGIVW